MSRKVGVFFSILGLLLMFLIMSIVFFNSHYFPSSILTVIETNSSIDIGLCDNETVSEKILTSINDLEYNLLLSDGDKIVIKLSDVFTIKSDDIVKVLEKNPMSIFNFGNTEFTLSISDIANIDTNKVTEIVNEIDNKSIDKIEPISAYITYDDVTKKYKIVEEVYGNILSDNALNCLTAAFEQFVFDIDLKSIGFYKEPEILSDSDSLNKTLDLYNEYTNTVITYNFGGNLETIDVSVYGSWLKENLNEDGSLNTEIPFYIDDSLLSEYVSSLNSKYTTFGMSRTIKTSTGETKTITTGDYGWWVNIPKMKEDISNHILTKTSEKKDAIYRQTAVQYGDLDFGNSYVEVSIDNQKLWMYLNGECIVDTDIVTGNIKNGWGTRKGVFSLTYKERNATLNGPGYSTPVSYWMPFDGGIGLHDATWRSSFGGSIYKYNGSHGCVNMPFNAAKTVYENLDSTMPIIVW